MEPAFKMPQKMEIFYFEQQENTATMPIQELFAGRKGTYLNEFNLFIAYFNTIPNFMHEIKINCAKASHWFLDTYENDIKDVHYTKRFFKGSDHAVYDEIFYLLYDDLLVNFDTSNSIVRFLFRKTVHAKVEAVVEGIRKFRGRQEKHQPRITLLLNINNSIDTKSLQLYKPKLNIEDNYNDDFKPIHEIIIKRLRKKNDKGLVLLHGKPGTGKTSYIRYLASLVKKEVIFLPSNLAVAMDNPSLVGVMVGNPNSIFVIEDAEHILVDRNANGDSPVSALLNISDGLLSDCLNIQIICSFNTDISKVDNALLRKGRLIARYEFKELETNKAHALSQKLGFHKTITAPMTLTAVYNQDENDFTQIKKGNAIGFNQYNF